MAMAVVEKFGKPPPGTVAGDAELALGWLALATFAIPCLVVVMGKLYQLRSVDHRSDAQLAADANRSCEWLKDQLVGIEATGAARRLQLAKTTEEMEAATLTLARLGSRGASATALLLSSSRPEIRRSAAKVLGLNMEGHHHLRQLRACLKDNNAEVRASALCAITQHSGTQKRTRSRVADVVSRLGQLARVGCIAD